MYKRRICSWALREKLSAKQSCVAYRHWCNFSYSILLSAASHFYVRDCDIFYRDIAMYALEVVI